MKERRRVKHLLTLEERLTIEAKDLRLRARAERMQSGQQGDDVIRRSRQADTASQIAGWIRSAGLRAPTAS
jgi:hypothetical protein